MGGGRFMGAIDIAENRSSDRILEGFEITLDRIDPVLHRGPRPMLAIRVAVVEATTAGSMESSFQHSDCLAKASPFFVGNFTFTRGKRSRQARANILGQPTVESA